VFGFAGVIVELQRIFHVVVEKPGAFRITHVGEFRTADLTVIPSAPGTCEFTER
jgi:hypothetical protein